MEGQRGISHGMDSSRFKHVSEVDSICIALHGWGLVVIKGQLL